MDTPSDASDPHIGRVLQERYRILRLLGRGGMGTVYEAEHVLIESRLAVKFLHPELATQTDAVQRFVNEARAASSIGHEHIVRVTDMGRLGESEHYMVLEFLDGQSLAELLDDSLLEVGRVLRIARMVCAALDAAHAKGIVHRDLKPENVFLVPTDEGDFVKLLDFGIAKFHEQSGMRTKTGAVMGTPAYMAPEQARGKQVDARTDVFSLGVILYEALAGFHPFDADSFVDILYRVAHEEPERLERFRPDLDPRLAELVHRMLAKAPADRPASCTHVEQELARCAIRADGVDPLQQTAPQGRYDRPSATTLDADSGEVELVVRRRGWIALALLAFLVGVVAALGIGDDVPPAEQVEIASDELPVGLPVPPDETLAAEARAESVAEAEAETETEAEAEAEAVAEAPRRATMRARRLPLAEQEPEVPPDVEPAMTALAPPVMDEPPPLGGFKRVPL